MPKSTLDREIRTCIYSFVEELSALVKQAAVDSVADALGGAAPDRRRGPGRPRTTAPKRGKPVRRSAGSLDAAAARVLSHVKANPGSGVTEIAAALRKTSKNLRLPIQKLLEEKVLRTTGQRRGTKYHAVVRGAPRKRSTVKKKAKRKTKRKATKKKTKKKAKRTKAKAK